MSGNRYRESGFTIVEGLVSTAILLIVAIGVIPLFASAILNNSHGSDLTQTANFSKSQEEYSLGLPFDNPALAVPAGDTKAQAFEWWQPNQGLTNDAYEGWQVGTTSVVGASRWTRTTTVQQFGINDIAAMGTLPAPLAGSTQRNFYQVKLITVDVQSSKAGGILGGGKRITTLYLKTF